MIRYCRLILPKICLAISTFRLYIIYLEVDTQYDEYSSGITYAFTDNRGQRKRLDGISIPLPHIDKFDLILCHLFGALWRAPYFREKDREITVYKSKKCSEL